MSKTFAFKDGDWDMQANGQPRMIADVSKAGQDVVHTLSQPYDPSQDLGFEFLDTDVQVLEGGAGKGILRRDITAAIARLRRKQTTVPGLTDSETITGIKNITIKDDGRGLLYRLRFLVGRLTRQQVDEAFIISNRHRDATRR